MLAALYPFFAVLDGWLTTFVSPLIAVIVWGAVAGAAAMLVYNRLSDQPGIAAIKSDLRTIRRRMLNPSIDDAELRGLIKTNLTVSLRYLGKVTTPSVLAGLPVLVIVVWVSYAYSYAIPTNEAGTAITISPPGVGLHASPEPAISGESGRFVLKGVAPDVAVRLQDESGREVYHGKLLDPPVPVVAKFAWHDVILGNVAGYLDRSAAVDKIEIALERRVMLAGVPEWASGWELPFFLTMLVVALVLKFALKVH